MSNEKIIRAWKDEEYLAGLGGAERAGLPAHPAGAIDLSEADLEEVSGGILSQAISCLPWCVWTLVGPFRCFEN